MSREDLLKELILTKFGSVAKFAEATDIPYTTIRNIFTRGIDGVGVGTVVKMCKRLNIDVEAFMDGNYALRPNSQKDQVWLEYAARKNSTLPLPEISERRNLIKLVGRDGSVTVKELTDAELAAYKTFVDKLPEADDL